MLAFAIILHSFSVYLNDIRSPPSPTTGKGYIFAGICTVAGGLLFFGMSFAETHHSNADVLQKHTCTCDQQIAEAAALLDITADGVISKPLNNAQYVISPIQLRKPPVRDANNMQLQCYLTHKEKQKQSVLSKISEEREMGQCDLKEVPHVSTLDKVADYLMGRKDPEDKDLSNSSSGIDPCHLISENSSSSDKNNRQEKHLNDRKEKVVKVELFDPPSQEKESTATVSYDSDLYINLCEAQV